MASDNSGCLRCLLFIFTGFFWFLGLGCAAVGIWMNADKDVVHWFMVMRNSPSDETLTAASIILVFIGFVMCFVGFLGCCGAMKGNRTMLSLFVFFIVVILIIEVTTGFVVVAFKDRIHRNIKGGMSAQIQGHYEWESGYGKAWNWVQVRLRCCGVDGSWDYRGSNWFHGQNPGVETEEEASIFVPKSCCKLDMNQDRDVSRVNPQDPRPKDERRCQEDAAGMKDGSDYLNGRGCYASVMDFIRIHMDVLIGLGLGVGLFQILGLILGVCVLCNMDQTDEDEIPQKHFGAPSQKMATTEFNRPPPNYPVKQPPAFDTSVDRDPRAGPHESNIL